MMMQTAVSNMKSYDWPTWFLGIMRSFISGGSSAIVSAAATMGIDPEHFNLTTGFKHTILLMVTMFVFMGVIHMAMYLQTHGAPDQLQHTLQAAADANVKAGEAIAEAKAQAPEVPKPPASV
jgi:hypothetical protein